MCSMLDRCRRFGRVEVDPGSASYELFTRSGNVEQPVRGRNDWGWSDWQPLKDNTVASPPGRFLQWKAVLRAGGRVGSVGVNYLPVNAAPVIDDLVVATGARLNPQNVAANPQQIVNISFFWREPGWSEPRRSEQQRAIAGAEGSHCCHRSLGRA